MIDSTEADYLAKVSKARVGHSGKKSMSEYNDGDLQRQFDPYTG